MKPLRLKISEECKRKKVAQHVVEKDYALSYILAGMASQQKLLRSLIFKGGTALKKIYFGEYRFSEDLDFSVIDAPTGDDLESALRDAVSISKQLLNNHGPFDVTLKRNPESAPHPKGQDAFVVNVQFPWHRAALCRIKIEITHDEPIILSPVYKLITHGYEEDLSCELACYHIEEIIAEKMRALLQTQQKLVTKGWARPRARDYYDLWCVLKNYKTSIDHARIKMTLNKKCHHRNVTYTSIDDFFTDELKNEAHQHWSATLGILMRNLPLCGEVLSETRLLIKDIIGVG